MDTEQNKDAITITMIGKSRVQMQGGRIIAIETTCLSCHRTYWLPVQARGTFRHTCERTGGASVINKYG
jgi:hypothetical protein